MSCSLYPQYAWLIVVCCWWSVVVEGDCGFISRRDHDFVGEDPVLSAEIARRIARGAGRARNKELPPAPAPSRAQILRLCQEGMLPPPDCTRPTAEDARRQINREKGRGEGHWHKYNQFPEDWNETHLYATQLKIAEQSIYSVQIRLNDFDKIVGRYKKDERFRIAYISKKLEMWANDMSLLFDYSHRNMTKQQQTVLQPWYHWRNHINNTHGDPRMFSTYKHIVYYQLILRRYIDIVYTLDILRKVHGELYDQHQAEVEQFSQLQREHDAAVEEAAKAGAGDVPPGLEGSQSMGAMSPPPNIGNLSPDMLAAAAAAGLGG